MGKAVGRKELFQHRDLWVGVILLTSKGRRLA